MFKSAILEVVGDLQLHCSGCEQRVERLLKRVHGVAQVHAQAKNQRIEVMFDSGVAEPAAIQKRLREAGYETREATSQQPATTESISEADSGEGTPIRNAPLRGKNHLRPLAAISTITLLLLGVAGYLLYLHAGSILERG
ncbi:MAG: hypothetical protein EPN47_04570 [Acidobacteria bacterium]|nr:MAG: hypothetical protein EPN47_04570 [Acidobacteriota bacterium]